jgi:hypothetical protein
VKPFAADLHLHTALSPCAEDEMTPPAIVLAAIEAGLDIIAICDHNSAGNVAAVQQMALEYAEGSLEVLAGIEITTAEEVHLVGLFPTAQAAELAGNTVSATLPTLAAASRVYGEQFLLDARGAILGKEPRTLSMASALSLAEAVLLIRQHGGLAVPAHVDRPSFSVTSQLGFVPEDLHFDAIEISAAGCRAGRPAAFAYLGLPMLTSSDAHFLSDIGGSRTMFLLEAPTFVEIAGALRADLCEGRCRIA